MSANAMLLPKKTPTSSLSWVAVLRMLPNPPPGIQLSLPLQRPNCFSSDFGTEVEPGSEEPAPGVSLDRGLARHAHPATVRLPQEVVEIIVAYLIYDSLCLCSCSLTCYAW